MRVPHVFVSDQDGMEAMARECKETLIQTVNHTFKIT